MKTVGPHGPCRQFGLGRMALACLPVVAAGCMPLMEQQQSINRQAHQRPTPAMAATDEGQYRNPYAAVPPSVAEGTSLTGEDGEQPRLQEARAQVMAFVTRLGDLEESGDPEPTTPAPPAHQSPPAKETQPMPVETDTGDRPRPQAIAPIEEDAISSDGVIEQETPHSVAEGESDQPAANDGADGPPQVLNLSVHVPFDPPDIADDSHDQVSSETAPAINTPLAADDSGQGKGGIDELVDQLEARIEASPNDARTHWRLGLLRMAAGEAEPASDAFDRLSEPSATILRRAMSTMVATRRAVEDPVRSIDEMLVEVDALRDELKNRAALVISTVALCSQVRAFGVYDEIPQGSFAAYTLRQAIVYLELQNFTSVPTADGNFRTLLSNRLELMTPEGRVLWQHNVAEIEDISRRRREDFFVAQRITLPAALAEGSYILKVTVQDLLGDKATQAIHPFSVGTSGTRR